MKWLHELFSPTLTRRLFFTVLFANMLVLLAIFIKDAISLQIEQNDAVSRYIKRASYRLDQLVTEQDAIIFCDAWGNIIRDIGALSPWAKVLPLIEVWTLDGKRVFPEKSVSPLPLGESVKKTKLVINEENYDYFRHDGVRWSLRIAVHVYPLHEAMIVTLIHKEFYLRPVVSFPILMLPLWFAVRRGLKPLRQLAAKLVERKVDDLSPLGFATRHRELQPMVAALDSLLLQLHGKVQREYAFLQDAAHELRTPIAVISAQTHVLAKAASPAEELEAQQHIDHAMARATHLTAQLTELARVDAASTQDRQVLDMVQLVKRDLAQLAPQAQIRQIEMTLEAPPMLEYCLEKNTFQSILHNFVRNAIAYGHVGGKVVVTLAHEGSDLLLQVADDGPGIAANEQERVFERFYRRLGNEVMGSGLGLAIVRQAVVRLGARLELKDGLHGKGCCFSVRIPGTVSS